MNEVGRGSPPRSVFTWEVLSGFRATLALNIGYFGVVATPLVKFGGVLFPKGGGVDEAMLQALALPLTLIFIASLLLSIAHLANEVLCPQLIRAYPSFILFHKAVAEFSQHAQTISDYFRRRESEQLRREINKRMGALPDEHREKLAQALDLYAQASEDDLPTPANDYAKDWCKANTSMTIARYAIAVLYMLSALVYAALIIMIFRELGARNF